MCDSAMHEHGRQQRQIYRDRSRLQSWHLNAITRQRILQSAIRGDNIRSCEDFFRNGGETVSKLLVAAQALEKNKDHHIQGHQKIRDDRRRNPAGIVITDWEDHLRIPKDASEIVTRMAVYSTATLSAATSLDQCRGPAIPFFAFIFRNALNVFDVCGRLRQDMMQIIANADEGKSLLEEFSNS